MLAASASGTTRMRLLSAVTVLNSDDPIRVSQRFSTVDAASSGRAEVILGHGSFTESFPLFGFGQDDYDTLFGEELDLCATVLAHDRTERTSVVDGNDARAARGAASVSADGIGHAAHIRADREKQFQAEFSSYVNAKSDLKPFDHVIVTIEFDPPRLV